MDDEDFAAILYCPVCTTPVDVEETGEVELDCDTCQTRWTIAVDPEIIAVHSHT